MLDIMYNIKVTKMVDFRNEFKEDNLSIWKKILWNNNSEKKSEK